MFSDTFSVLHVTDKWFQCYSPFSFHDARHMTLATDLVIYLFSLVVESYRRVLYDYQIL